MVACDILGGPHSLSGCCSVSSAFLWRLGGWKSRLFWTQCSEAALHLRLHPERGPYTFIQSHANPTYPVGFWFVGNNGPICGVDFRQGDGLVTLCSAVLAEWGQLLWIEQRWMLHGRRPHSSGTDGPVSASLRTAPISYSGRVTGRAAAAAPLFQCNLDSSSLAAVLSHPKGAKRSISIMRSLSQEHASAPFDLAASRITKKIFPLFVRMPSVVSQR